MECRSVWRNAFQITNLIAYAYRVYPDKRTVFQMRFHNAGERAGQHFLLVFTLSLFRRQSRLFIPYLLFHFGYAALMFRLKSVFYWVNHLCRFCCILLSCCRFFVEDKSLLHSLCLPCPLPESCPAFHAKPHHRLIKAVDGRIFVPIQRGIDGFLMCLFLRHNIFVGRFLSCRHCFDRLAAEQTGCLRLLLWAYCIFAIAFVAFLFEWL